MGYFLGCVLVIFGLLILAFGDKKLNVKEGAILKAFSLPPLNAKVTKWAVGIICIWFGVAIVLGGGKL
jgi:uncharacterized membrane protein YidH (DUF202 family)